MWTFLVITEVIVHPGMSLEIVVIEMACRYWTGFSTTAEVDMSVSLSKMPCRKLSNSDIYKGVAGPNNVRVGIFRVPRCFVLCLRCPHRNLTANFYSVRLSFLFAALDHPKFPREKQWRYFPSAIIMNIGRGRGGRGRIIFFYIFTWFSLSVGPTGPKQKVFFVKFTFSVNFCCAH
jgi:hypothetical protein